MGPAVPLRARTDWKSLVQKLGGAAVPVVTIGAGSPILLGILAFRRRSLPLALLASVSAAIAGCFWGIDWQAADGWWVDLILIGQLLSIVAASVTVAVVIASPRRYAGARIHLNEVSADDLAALPGLDQQRAAGIVASRDSSGRFRRVDELWSRGLLQGVPTDELLDRLMVVPVQDRR